MLGIYIELVKLIILIKLLKYLMNIDMVTLQSFLALAETGSFTKTAEHVGRTQSAISQQIAYSDSCEH